MSEDNEICINPKDFDISRVVIHDAVKNEFTIGDNTVTTTTSKGRYLDDDGNECKLYFYGPPQLCFGVSYQHPMMLSKEEKTPDTAKGLQICYPLTGLSTVHKPKPEEQHLIDLFDGLWNAAVEKGKEAMDDDNTQMPQVAINSFVAASRKKQWRNAVKYPCDYPKDPKTKKPDTNKPLRMYTKLLTSGEGPTLRAKMSFRGPGDKKENPIKYLDTKGIITPVWEWEGVYYGAHGPEAPYGASLRFKIVEANFTPKDDHSGPKSRFLPRNDSQAEDEDYSNVKEEEGSDEGFDEP
jgi:hypothetical protein